jgi:hypothetical protein
LPNVKKITLLEAMKEFFNSYKPPTDIQNGIFDRNDNDNDLSSYIEESFD